MIDRESIIFRHFSDTDYRPNAYNGTITNPTISQLADHIQAIRMASEPGDYATIRDALLTYLFHPTNRTHQNLVGLLSVKTTLDITVQKAILKWSRSNHA